MSFDNVGMAWTAIFLVISLEGWTEIMYYVQGKFGGRFLHSLQSKNKMLTVLFLAFSSRCTFVLGLDLLRKYFESFRDLPGI